MAVGNGETTESERVAAELTPFVEQMLGPWEDSELPDPIELPTPPFRFLLTAVEGAREAHADDPDVRVMLDRWLRDAYVLAGEFERAWELTKLNEGFYGRKGVSISDVLHIRNHCADDSLDGNDLLSLLGSDHCLTSVGICLKDRVAVQATTVLAEAHAKTGCNVVKGFLLYIDERLPALPESTRAAWRPECFAYSFFAEAKARTGYRLWRMFASWSGQRPYLVAFLNDFLRQAEDLARTEAGLPKINEGWVSETELFYLLEAAFPEHDVVHHGSPSWLGPQHLDIYFPNERVAVEFQGEQHFRPVALFGGEESFAAQQERDKRKREACARNDCALLEVARGYDFEDIHAWVAESLSGNKPGQRNRVSG